MRGRRWVALCVLGLSSLVGGSAWAVYKCVDANGRTSFQDEPCAAGQKATEVDVTPSSKGIVPTEGSKPIPAGISSSASQAIPSAPADQRPNDCPDAATMQKLQIEAESVALPLPIRNQKRQDFEALKQRCSQ